MYKITKNRIITDKIELKDIIDVVINVHEYKNFVPWCKDVVMIENCIAEKQYFIADLVLEVLHIKHTYRSKTTILPKDNGFIITTTGDETNILKYLNSKWDLIKTNDAIIVNYNLDIDLKVNIPFIPIEQMLNTASDKIVESFEKQVKKMNNDN